MEKLKKAAQVFGIGIVMLTIGFFSQPIPYDKELPRRESDYTGVLRKGAFITWDVEDIPRFSGIVQNRGILEYLKMNALGRMSDSKAKMEVEVYDICIYKNFVLVEFKEGEYKGKFGYVLESEID